MVQEELIALVRQEATRHHLDPALVCAVCEQESNWNPWAIRFEPQFRLRYVAPLGLPPTEEIARSTSWGLMQVMGQVAREHGFSEAFLSHLCDPSTGVAIGCMVLAGKLAECSQDVTRALLAWNGGGNSSYPGVVQARMSKFRRPE